MCNILTAANPRERCACATDRSAAICSVLESLWRVHYTKHPSSVSLGSVKRERWVREKTMIIGDYAMDSSLTDQGCCEICKVNITQYIVKRVEITRAPNTPNCGAKKSVIRLWRWPLSAAYRSRGQFKVQQSNMFKA